jgi:hypothetical protein
MTQRFEATPDMIGKYVNRHLYTDVKCVGRIVGIKSKTKLIIEIMEATVSPDFKPEWQVGGFSAICMNQWAQEWIHTPTGETFELRLSAGDLKRRLSIDTEPQHYYDYNF